MKLFKILTLVGIIAGLSACNTGSTSTNSTYISINPQTCNNITANTSCNVQVTYSASSGSSSIGQVLIMSTPTGYTEISTNCGSQPISTTSQTCNFIVSCTNNVCNGVASTAYICPTNQASSCSSYQALGLQSY